MFEEAFWLLNFWLLEISRWNQTASEEQMSFIVTAWNHGSFSHIRKFFQLDLRFLRLILKLDIPNRIFEIFSSVIFKREGEKLSW